ncbi:unnamed protein product [Protopolystoma xenopodis]|uniref:Uncharacterized protein n=1 Tax=Protopolystoma xenopodis TaxID=117903 RepID=A0A3S5C0X0_9PLAT|nr:unnamed protein product [Protopolystoma xenopodis]
MVFYSGMDCSLGVVWVSTAPSTGLNMLAPRHNDTGASESQDRQSLSHITFVWWDSGLDNLAVAISVVYIITFI